MNDVIILDATPLGLLCAPFKPGLQLTCHAWLHALLASGRKVYAPEISDYEVRRELIRAKKSSSIRRLNSLYPTVEYLPITTAAMLRAADLWALARQTGQPTAGNNNIDADMIAIAQAERLGVPFVIATKNTSHLSRFTHSQDWQLIQP